MGIPKCFNFLGCLEVTLILRDFKTVTGKIVDFDNRKKFDCFDKHDDHDKKDEHDDHDKKNDDKCCSPKVDVKVDVDDKCDFILLELTKDAESVSLQEIETNCNIEIELLNVEFKKGSCIAVNVCDIIYAGVNAELEKAKIEIYLPGAVTEETEPMT